MNGGAALAADQPRSDAQDVGDAEERRQVRDDCRARSRTQRGVIYTIAPSYQDINRIWVGTDDGLIHVTDRQRQDLDATSRRRRSRPWAKVSLIDAGRFSPLTAYAAINTLRLDDLRPHIFRTHDGGKTWTEIVNGIPAGETVNAVREDPKKKGLLFAGTERAVYVSFDDGANWQSLRLNMGVTSVRDLIVKDDDLVSRDAWPRLLDPRRHHAAAADDGRRRGHRRGRRAVQADHRLARPLEHEHRHALAGRGADRREPAGRRDHQLLPEGQRRPGRSRSRSRDADGRLVRRYSSSDPVTPIPTRAGSPVPLYWFRPPQPLSTAAGLHRFIWDVHYQPLPNLPGGGRRAGGRRPADPGDPAQHRAGADHAVGRSGRLHDDADGRRKADDSQPIEVKQDPRVTTPAVDDAAGLRLDEPAVLRSGRRARGRPRGGRAARAGRQAARHRHRRARGRARCVREEAHGTRGDGWRGRRRRRPRRSRRRTGCAGRRRHPRPIPCGPSGPRSPG